jgi:hypothetical protein
LEGVEGEAREWRVTASPRGMQYIIAAAIEFANPGWIRLQNAGWLLGSVIWMNRKL